MAKLNVVHKLIGLGRVHSFMFYSGSGRVRSLHLWVGSTKSVSSFSKYSVHKSGNRRIDAWTDEGTDGQAKNIMSPPTSLAW